MLVTDSSASAAAGALDPQHRIISEFRNPVFNQAEASLSMPSYGLRYELDPNQTRALVKRA